MLHSGAVVSAGKPVNESSKVFLMLHGRGADAESILSLARHLSAKDAALLAPQANNRTWYPYSFMAPLSQNEPWLSSALDVVENLLKGIIVQGIPPENCYFVGFSQGACLALEFVARHAARYGGVFAFSGGLIGDNIYRDHYTGDFKGTPIFIGASDPDAHIPIERVYATTNILKSMHASVSEKVYPNMGHTITPAEIDDANQWIFNQQLRG